MELPLEYKRLKAHDFKLLSPWYFTDPEDSVGLRREYQVETGMDMVPFATRQDNDDIAGFIIKENQAQSSVITVHLTWSGKLERQGYPISKQAKDIFDWINEVVV